MMMYTKKMYYVAAGIVTLFALCAQATTGRFPRAQEVLDARHEILSRRRRLPAAGPLEIKTPQLKTFLHANKHFFKHEVVGYPSANGHYKITGWESAAYNKHKVDGVSTRSRIREALQKIMAECAGSRQQAAAAEAYKLYALIPTPSRDDGELISTPLTLNSIRMPVIPVVQYHSAPPHRGNAAPAIPGVTVKSIKMKSFLKTNGHHFNYNVNNDGSYTVTRCTFTSEPGLQSEIIIGPLRLELAGLAAVKTATAQRLEASALLMMLPEEPVERLRMKRNPSPRNTSPRNPPKKLSELEIRNRKCWIQNKTGENPTPEVYITMGKGFQWYKANITDPKAEMDVYEVKFTLNGEACKRKFKLKDTNTKVLTPAQYKRYILKQ